MCQIRYGCFEAGTEKRQQLLECIIHVPEVAEPAGKIVDTPRIVQRMRDDAEQAV
jgi:hypothetical protein